MVSAIKSPLQPMFDAIAQAPTRSALRELVVETCQAYFAANRCSLLFLEDLPKISKEQPVLMQRALSLEHNPVLRYLVERHAAVHDEVLLPPGIWKTICPRADHAHVLLGPVIQQGKLIGSVGLTRDRQAAAFNSENIADVSALCLHLSSRLETLRRPTEALVQRQAPAPTLPPGQSEPAMRSPKPGHGLTPRETEIAALVAQGLTNKEIGVALWITENSVKQALKRMFRKLEVASRAEMVMQLYAAAPPSF